MRRKVNYKREYVPDIKHGSVVITRFINYIMRDGERSVAEKVVYGAFDQIQKATKQEPVKVFEKALDNVAPAVETSTRRVGGANYQIPVEVKPKRQLALSIRWIIGACRSKKGKSMAENLAQELQDASKEQGNAFKKREDVHRMAAANKAFAHFARYNR